jgi:hypothetical protein
MRFIKNDDFVNDPQIPMSEWISKTMEQFKTTLPFSSIFQTKSILIPIPKSSLMNQDTLWVPQRIALALAKKGFGAEVVSCLKRITPIRKSATSLPENRPKVGEQFRSMGVEGRLAPPEEIVLIDDIITRGATFFGASMRLLEAFPETHISAFAAMRTISNPIFFENFYNLCIGSIQYREETDDTMRNP